jgi:hypothetical protein
MSVPDERFNLAWYKTEVARLETELERLRAELERITAERDATPEIVRCKDCELKDTQLCRASKSIHYDLRKEKHTYKTFMEPDGFCSGGSKCQEN